MTNKILIAYHSVTGHTKTVAEAIQAQTGGEIFEITPNHFYSSDVNDYEALTKQAKKEYETNFRPELKKILTNIENYDTIFIGSPNWWSTVSIPIYSLLENLDTTGKTIIPFITHGGGGLSNTISDLKKLCPKANVLEPIEVHVTRANGFHVNVQEEVTKGVQQIT
ncbi:MAG: NAD(P)H-dependent oxidoreductase [Streptococcaceae bacterium]|jgi:flavodoxin|nr:NAD(P)H-dependent oxidoreductase [Streptococcaceae bacterium]